MPSVRPKWIAQVKRRRSPDLFSEIEDTQLQQYVRRLHATLVKLRWLTVVALWVFLLPPVLWVLRRDIQLMLDTFTWTAVRYALAFKPWTAVALSLCIGMTLGVLVWQSRNILYGLPDNELKRLKKQARRICERGDRHPLWRWVCK
ncbi:MAG: hypothetical protein AAFY26_25980 [Cyanobacteria bacterium J06638_22]